MAATLFSAVVTCVASLFIGQAALRVAGAREWSWLAPPVGIAVVMMIATPALDVPGRAATVTVLVGALTIAAIVWCVRAPEHRPPLAGLLAAAPVMLLVLLPFLAVGRAGILGTTMDNDMAAHMSFAEAFLSQAAMTVMPPQAEYPLGPHAMSALIAEGLGVRIDRAFAGWTMALPVLNAWTALALVRRAWWPKQVVMATVVGMPFLVAAYYGEGSFKEVVQTGLVLAVVLLFSGYGPALGRGRWVPFALLVGGIVSVYSITGLPWPGAIAGLWLIGTLTQRIVRHGTKGMKESILRELPAIGIGVAVLVAFLLPQVRRIHNFISLNLGNEGIVVPKDVLANLVAPLPGWEAFGVWNNPDFRLPASPAFTGGMWTAFVLALVLFGAFWLVRRGRWMLPLAAAASMAIWAVSQQSQSPYVVAKALVIASPLLMAVAVLPLMEQAPDRWPRRVSSLFERVPGQPLSWGLASLLALVLVFKVGLSDVRALRASPVGPTYHVDELRSLRPLLHGQPTLFLGNDDYVKWELAGVPVSEPMFGGVPETSTRPNKRWASGMAIDLDTVDAATLNSHRWIVTTRDAAGSAPPPQLRLVRTTPSFALWHRLGKVHQRSILAEGELAGAVLDCRTPIGRAVRRGGGIAATRPEPVVAQGALLPPGGTASVPLSLVPGRWQLESSYLSRLPIEVTAPGLRTTLQPSLDRPGPRWPIGEIAVHGKQPTVLTFRVEDRVLAPNMPVADLGKIVATRDAQNSIVPVSQACGRYVDWYRPRSSRPGG
jgi:hypothetical protein